MTTLTLTRLHKAFAATPVLTDIRLQVASGELLALVGPSGSGKSTLLRLIAGLLKADSGDIAFDSQIMNKIPAEKRGAVIVFQENQLFPFMTVADNIAFGLKIKRWRRHAIRQRIAEVLEWVHLAGYERRYPDQLSGGERQRVALARALAITPRLLLLDEPFSQLDAPLRDELRREVMHLQKQLGLTTLFVTHDQSEAVAVADRIAVLMNGQLAQVGVARECYERPQSRAVAEFFGGANLLMVRKQGNCIAGEGYQLQIDSSALPDGEVLALIRPEAIQMGANGTNTLRGIVQEWVYQGEQARGVVKIGATCWQVTTPPHLNFAPQTSLDVHIAPEHIWLLPRS